MEGLRIQYPMYNDKPFLEQVSIHYVCMKDSTDYIKSSDIHYKTNVSMVINEGSIRM